MQITFGTTMQPVMGKYAQRTTVAPQFGRGYPGGYGGFGLYEGRYDGGYPGIPGGADVVETPVVTKPTRESVRRILLQLGALEKSTLWRVPDGAALVEKLKKMVLGFDVEFKGTEKSALKNHGWYLHETKDGNLKVTNDAKGINAKSVIIHNLITQITVLNLFQALLSENVNLDSVDLSNPSSEFKRAQETLQALILHAAAPPNDVPTAATVDSSPRVDWLQENGLVPLIVSVQEAINALVKQPHPLLLRWGLVSG